MRAMLGPRQNPKGRTSCSPRAAGRPLSQAPSVICNDPGALLIPLLPFSPVLLSHRNPSLSTWLFTKPLSPFPLLLWAPHASPKDPVPPTRPRCFSCRTAPQLPPGTAQEHLRKRSLLPSHLGVESLPRNAWGRGPGRAVHSATTTQRLGTWGQASASGLRPLEPSCLIYETGTESPLQWVFVSGPRKRKSAAPVRHPGNT